MLVNDADPTDPWAREAQTFPALVPEMIGRVANYGEEVVYLQDTLLFERGQRDIDFFLVLDGQIDILVDSVLNGRKTLFSYRYGQFSGEQNLFTQREMLFSGLAKPGTRLLRVSNGDFQRLMVGEPDIGEIIIRAFILRRTGFFRHSVGGVAIIGERHHSDLLRIERFLTRNFYPVEIFDPVADLAAAKLISDLNVGPQDLPAVVTPEHRVFRNPSNAELADSLGISEKPDLGVVYDLAVVGAGPGGLSAAVYGASEGLKTLVLEGLAPGGQAGRSSKIENYLGFPTGISGQGLAGRAHIQAQKFGARISVSREASKLDCTSYPFRILLSDGTALTARSVVVATGAKYRTLNVPNYEKFEGQGIYYSATALEAQVCTDENIIVVGGGNSAGQAALFLSRTVRHVHMLMRSGISSSMSDYLVQRIKSSPHITLHQRSEVTALHGDKTLESATWIDHETGEEHVVPVTSLFVMIGASPNTEWLNDCVTLDEHGFIETGKPKDGKPVVSSYETSLDGVYAVGDVRAGSVKRVASAVGEGSVVISAVHQFLEEQRERLARDMS